MKMKFIYGFLLASGLYGAISQAVVNKFFPVGLIGFAMAVYGGLNLVRELGLVSDDYMHWTIGKDKEPKKPKEPEREPDATYSFRPVGSRYDCKFSSGNRQNMIMRTKAKDKFILKEYEWQGERALAVINTRLNADIGTVRKSKDLPRLLRLMEEYPIMEGEVTNIDEYERGHEDDLYIEIKMKFYVGEGDPHAERKI